jgi:hypothetical protein
MDDERDRDDDLFEQLERRALFAMPEEEEEEEVDVLAPLRTGAAAEAAATADALAADQPAPDMSLGGYIEEHSRVPAFEGSDAQPYTVDIDVEATHDPDRAFVAFLVFIRWAATGAGIMDHLESGDVAVGATEAEARERAFDLSLYEVRAELDSAIARRRAELEG